MSDQDSENTGGPDLSEAIGTRVSPGTHERFISYRDDHGYTNAEAMRELIRNSLDRHEQNDQRNRAVLAGALFFYGVGMILLADPTNPLPAYIMATLLPVLLLLLPYLNSAVETLRT